MAFSKWLLPIGVGLGTLLLLGGTAAAAAQPQQPQTSGAPPNVYPAPSGTATTTDGPKRYTVTLQSSAALNLRQGPGIGWAVIGSVANNAVVAASGLMTVDRDSDGYRWAIIVDGSGNPIGWAATDYLQES